MTRHQFDPMSAALGALAVGLGIIVMLGDPVRASSWWAVAAAVLVLGVGMLPWSRRRPARPAGIEDDPPNPSL